MKYRKEHGIFYWVFTLTIDIFLVLYSFSLIVLYSIYNYSFFFYCEPKPPLFLGLLILTEVEYYIVWIQTFWSKLLIMDTWPVSKAEVHIPMCLCLSVFIYMNFPKVYLGEELVGCKLWISWTFLAISKFLTNFYSKLLFVKRCMRTSVSPHSHPSLHITRC